MKNQVAHSIKKLLFISLLALSSLSAQGAIISLESDQDIVFIGEDIVVNMWVRDLGNDIVSAFDLDLSFNSLLVSNSMISFGDYLGADFDSEFDAVFSSDSINIAGFSYLEDSELELIQTVANQRIDIRLAQFTFSALNAGLADFNVSADTIFGGVFGEVISTFEVDTVVSNYPVEPLQVLIKERGNMDVSAPSMLIAFLLSIAGLLNLRLKRKGL